MHSRRKVRRRMMDSRKLPWPPGNVSAGNPGGGRPGRSASGKRVDGDQHIRISTRYSAKQRKTLMETSWLVSCIAAMSIVLAFPIGSLADQPDSAAARQLPLPKVKSSKGIYYPAPALRVGLEGTVVIGFDIAANGRATNIALISSDDKVFEQPSMELLKSATFELPKGTDGQDIHEARYRLGLVFCLPPSSLDDTFTMRVIPIVVSSTRIRGSPVRNPPAPGATGWCAKVE